jgi:hypothetical protein
MHQIFAAVLLASVTLANDSYLKQFEHLQKADQAEEYGTIPYIDDIQRGLQDDQ